MMDGGAAAAPRHQTVMQALEAAALSSRGLFFANARDQDTPLPYAELLRRARSTAARLAGLGVVPGDRVAMVLPTGIGFMDAFFGTLAAGAIPVPLYPPVRLGRMEEYHHRTARMLEVVGARVVLSDHRVRRLLGQAVARAQLPLGCHTLEDLANAPPSERAVTREPSDLALIQFSSGTTVDPKPVALSNANLMANMAAIDAYLRAANLQNHTGVTWLPLYHDMGLIGCLLEAIYYPGDLCLIPPEHFLARPASWLKALSRHRAPVSAAPNFAYGLCVKRIRDEELEGVDLSSWRFALNGAEPVSPAVLERFASRFAQWGFRAEALTPVYGLSEASLAVTFSARDVVSTARRLDADKLAREGVLADGDREVVSVGAPLAGIQVEIRDEDGQSLPDGRVGRVWVRGPSVMTGYFGNDAATAKAKVNDWLDTGDLGFVAEGELFLCGRAKEVVILRGANHAPQEFEEALDGLDGVRAGCVIAFGYQPMGQDGEELGLLVEIEGELPPTLKDAVCGRVAAATGVRPFEVALVAGGTLPRTSSGKLRRAEAARLFLAGELEGPRRVSVVGVAVEVARSELAFLKDRLRR